MPSIGSWLESRVATLCCKILGLLRNVLPNAAHSVSISKSLRALSYLYLKSSEATLLLPCFSSIKLISTSSPGSALIVSPAITISASETGVVVVLSSFTVITAGVIEQSQVPDSAP